MTARWAVLVVAVVMAASLPSLSGHPASESGAGLAASDAELEEAKRLLEADSFEPARVHLEAVLADARAHGDRGREAECLRMLGVAAFGGGDGDTGTSSMRAALRVARSLGDRRLEAAVLVDWANGHWRRAEYTAALTLLDEALEIQDELGDLSGRANALVVKGRVYFKTGAYDRALECHRQAMSIQESLDDLRAQAITLEDMGDVFNDRHEAANALELFDRSLHLREAIGDLQGQAWIHLVIGSCYLKQGAPRQAASHYQASLDIAARLGEPASEAAALYHLAGVDRRAGRCERAIIGYRSALALHEEVGDRRAAAWDHAMIGICCGQLGDLDQAQVHNERARALRQEIGDQRNLADSLEALADVRLAQGRLEEADRLYGEAVELSDQISLPYVSITLGKRAVALARKGEGREALLLGERALSSAMLVDNRDLLWQAQYHRGLVLRDLGQTREAAASMMDALDTIEELRIFLADDEEPRTGFLEDKQSVYADTVDLLLLLGRSGEALEVAERSRARALLDMLRRDGVVDGQALATPTQLPTHDLAGDDWPERLLGSRSRSGSTGSGSSPIAPPSDLPGRRSAAAALRVQGFSEQARLRRATIVEYLLSDRRAYIWVVDGEGGVTAATVAVARERLATLVASSRRISSLAIGEGQDAGSTVSAQRGATAPAEDAALAALRELHRLLVEPISSRLPSDPQRLVVVVPHGPLLTISFASLLGADGRFLGERHTLASVPSIDVLGRLQGPALSDVIDRAGLLLVANPTPPPQVAAGLASLAGAEREVGAIARLFPGSEVELLRGEGAREDRVRALAPRFGIIHLATHGLVRDDEPLESWLLLGSGQAAAGTPTSASGLAVGGEGSDGRWTAREIAGERLKARLVVLSACNTGLGRVTGDGVIGLSRAFLVAGVPSLVVSLWRVSDVVASFQMEMFYRALRSGGGGTAGALREAQLATRQALREGRLRAEDGRALPDHPALWAPFVVIGEGSDR